MTNTLISAAYHRNGVGGAGFYTALVHFTGDDPGDRDDRTMLLTWFPDTDNDGNLARYQECVAVVDVNQAAAGNIYMYPHPDKPGTGNNAWRGADNFADLLPQIKAMVEADRERAASAWTAARS